MSSYQFVNSLTSCYGQTRAGPDPVTGPSSVPGDYYTPQTYNNCYGSGGVSGVQLGPSPTAQSTSSPYSAYIQQNGDHHNPHHHGPHGHHENYSTSSCSQVASSEATSRLSHHGTSLGSVLGPNVHQPNRTPTPSSCKYVQNPIDSASSPQDLSTTSSTGAAHSNDSRGSPIGSV